MTGLVEPSRAIAGVERGGLDPGSTHLFDHTPLPRSGLQLGPLVEGTGAPLEGVSDLGRFVPVQSDGLAFVRHGPEHHAGPFDSDSHSAACELDGLRGSFELDRVDIRLWDIAGHQLRRVVGLTA